MKDDELVRTIAKLRAEYAEQLPGAVAQMESLWRGLIASEIPPLRLSEFVRMVHSITGSGSTFGLPEVSRAAAELESYLEQVKESGQLPGPAGQETVSALLAALRQAAIQR